MQFKTRFDFFLPTPDSEAFGLLQADFVWTLLSRKHDNMVQYHLPCQDLVFLKSFSGVMLCRVVVLLTPGELSFALLSSFSSTRLIIWHSTRNRMTPLDVNFGFFIPANKCQPSFHSMCAATNLFFPPFLSSLRLPCGCYMQVSMLGNVVCRSSLLISVPVLMIHNSTLAVTVTWRCHLVLHTSAQISW